MNKRLKVFTALSLPLLLAACGASTPVAVPPVGDTTALTLKAPFAALGKQGLPTDGSGASTVTTITVKVKDAQGQTVRFNGQNVFQKSGTQDTLTLTSAAPSATVLLPRGTYTFENIGTSAASTFLAYGSNPAVNLTTPASTTINLDLHALADQTATTFSDKMAWTSVVTQDILDLRLNVLNADGTLVPTGDFDAPTYQIVDAGGAPLAGVADVLGSSKLGTRVRAIGTTATTDLYVKATTQAWQATGADTAAKSILTKTFRIAFDKTGLSADMQAPKVTFGGTGLTVTAGQPLTMSGTASDDSGNVQSIRVYDGVELIGSTDSSEFGANGVGEIGFTGGAWTLSWTPATSGTPDITVIATDKAGNEGRPVVLKFAKNFNSVARWYNSVAVKADGTVTAWGWNGYNQNNVPAGLTGVKATAAGFYHTLVLKSDGTLVGWGSNSYGELNIPAAATSVVAVAAGFYNSLALKSDGTVVAWGNNDSNQSTVPAGLTGVVAVAAGFSHDLALKSDGTVVAWGNNSNGQTNVPAGLTGVVAVAAGSYHSLAVKNDGTVVAWGSNGSGRTNVPAGLTGVVAVAGGGYHSLALKSDGTVIAWGDNGNGQTNVPAGLTGVVAVAAGDLYSLALKSDGTIVAWGNNNYGQLNVPAGPYLVP